MRLYSFHTPAHAVLKDKWFLPSLKEDYELVIEQGGHESGEVRYKAEGWTAMMIQKIELILRAIEENKNEVFVYSDIDVQFFRPAKEAILKAIVGKDIVIQLESLKWMACPGFFAAKGNKKNLRLWQDIRDKLPVSGRKDDQDIMNGLLLSISKPVSAARRFINKILGNNFFVGLYKNPYGLKWRFLPLSFFSYGQLATKIWQPGIDFNVPDGIIMHHANWTVGLENKIRLMKYVKEAVEKKAGKR